jgi:hypothetical protein
MVDKPDEEKNRTSKATPANAPPITVRDVVVTQRDTPPTSGKRSIHPRRQAPVVPTREERTAKRQLEDTEPKKTDSE